jgi:hypothetical protein
MIAVLLSFLLSQSQSCQSTIFAYPGDKHDGGPSRYLKRKVRPDDMGIAHRTLPLGTPVIVCQNDSCAFGVVLDRGPYGMADEDGWFNAKLEPERARGGRYRGCADLTPALAEAINHDGFARVRLFFEL